MRGVTFNTATNKWRAVCAQKYLGEFSTQEDAIAARKNAEREMYGAEHDVKDVQIVDGVALIPLWARGGKLAGSAKVDAQDAVLVSKNRWSVVKSGYAVARISGGEFIYMHRLIIPKVSNEVVDHINGDKLDNRRVNLRVCAQHENMKNVAIKKNNSSGYPGVSKVGSGWRARIVHDRKEYSLGRFSTFEQAVAARKKAEVELSGSFARQVAVLVTGGDE